ncbi:hypothetical protein [Paenibacillus harenae]|uniref:Uncharacterized protein n=1 Tax=Paenibacillus harenae TaxID=306543 RepID=A0ABT9U0E2_PAEHA|nr:hypothetical protein [Paenibacillus harenae]MDQ0059686.1 hypothetical protein [Paenibacillus harenae]MDQ0113100.1 hypothetical protein [Paenibacillus harenae]
MLGTWRWNVGFGLVGTVLTVAFSLGANPLSVVLLRSAYAFIAFFVLAYAVRTVLAVILKPPALIGESEGTESAESETGAKLDIQTPDETADLNELLKRQMQEGVSTNGAQKQEAAGAFKPLNPPQLLSTKNSQPEELAKAIRHLTGE